METLKILPTVPLKSLLCVSLDSAARPRWDIPHLPPLRFSKCLSASCSTYWIGQHYVMFSEKVAKQAGCLFPLLIIYFKQMWVLRFETQGWWLPEHRIIAWRGEGEGLAASSHLGKLEKVGCGVNRGRNVS